MRIVSVACLSAWVLLASSAVMAQTGDKLDYGNQDKWVGMLDRAQSPIDIPTDKTIGATANEPRALDFWHARNAVGHVEDNGHAVQFDSSTIQALIRGRHSN